MSLTIPFFVMMKRALFILVTFLILFSSCSIASQQYEEGKEDANASEQEDKANHDTDSVFSVNGYWVANGRGLYHVDDTDVLDFLPPSATCPISQVQYYDIKDESVSHLIRVYSLFNDINEAVFQGEACHLTCGDDGVITDFYQGKEQHAIMYKQEKDSFVLVFEDSNLSYRPAIVFSRIGDKVWEDYSSKALMPGTADFDLTCNALDEYVKRYGLDHFVLVQYF